MCGKKLLPLPREGGRLARPEGFSAELEQRLNISVEFRVNLRRILCSQCNSSIQEPITFWAGSPVREELLNDLSMLLSGATF
jgi:hypothetical protein